MDPTLCLALRRNTTARAHLYGAEAVILDKQATDLALAEIREHSNRFQLHIPELLNRPEYRRGQEARRRYYRELEAVDLLGGCDSPFGVLGAEPA
jgi:hypothetical protein